MRRKEKAAQTERTDADLAAISAAKPGAVAVTLGPSVLRAETAACVALALSSLPKAVASAGPVRARARVTRPPPRGPCCK